MAIAIPAFVLDVVAEDQELVGGEPRQRVLGPQHRLQARGQHPQEVIAEVVTEAVVDQLEVVYVEQHQCDLRAVSA